MSIYWGRSRAGAIWKADENSQSAPVEELNRAGCAHRLGRDTPVPGSDSGNAEEGSSGAHLPGEDQTSATRKVERNSQNDTLWESNRAASGHRFGRRKNASESAAARLNWFLSRVAGWLFLVVGWFPPSSCVAGWFSPNSPSPGWPTISTTQLRQQENRRS